MNDAYLGGSKNSVDWTQFNWWGLFLLLIGVAWLGDTMRWWTFQWEMLGPLALVFSGLLLFVSRRR